MKSSGTSESASALSLDSVLSAGVEWQWKHETVAGERGNPEVQFEVGPSVQWRIGKSAYLNLVALFGTTNQGPRTETFLVFAWNFGGGKSDGRYPPLTGQRN